MVVCVLIGTKEVIISFVLSVDYSNLPAKIQYLITILYAMLNIPLIMLKVIHCNFMLNIIFHEIELNGIIIRVLWVFLFFV